MKTRVVQWASGAMGRTILRAILEHPDLELVGLFVYGAHKIGRDAGEIAGVGPVGVVATNRIEDILELSADVVVHAARIQPPYAHHNEDIQRLLASGKNVISINGHTRPAHWGAAYLQGFERACEQGRATLLGAGLNPGFAVEKIAAVASGMCTRVDSIRVSERVDTRSVKSPEYVFDVLGFGSVPGERDPNDPDWPPAEMLNGLFVEVVADLVDRLGARLDRVETAHEMHPGTEDLEIAAGRIEAGRVARTHWQWHGIVDGRRFFTLSIEWSMEPAPATGPATDVEEEPLWSVAIRGEPCVDVQIRVRRSDDDPRRTTPEQYGVAGAVLNAIPLVVAASPGVMRPPSAAPWQAPRARQRSLIDGSS